MYVNYVCKNINVTFPIIQLKHFEKYQKVPVLSYKLYVKLKRQTKIYSNDNNELDDYLYNVEIIYLQGYEKYDTAQRIFKLLKESMKNDQNYKNACQELKQKQYNRCR